MREIILEKRYPHSREEDIIDAFMRGYETGKASRPQGEWTQNVFRSDIYRYECSNCKAHHRARYDFCPSCGARMKERASDECDC